MADHITHDPIYNTLDRDNFLGMIEPQRYHERTDAFDSIISSTDDHFWDPTDPTYIDFSPDFPIEEQTLMPREMVPELNSAVVEKLDERQQVRLANENTRFMLSNILHGEQGALSLSASLCHILRDPGAQEYAANQTREEARHVTAFSRYVAARWGTPLRCGPTLAGLLDEVVRAPEVYKKLVGMQMLIEGLAMGAFATLNVRSRDPLLRRVVQLVMADEAFHHKFGKIWADRTVPELTPEEHAKVEDWAASCFQTLLFNLVNSEQKQEIYGEFGLDWRWVRGAVMEAFGDADRRDNFRHQTNIFRVLVKTLVKAGIITERTRPVYAAWVDLDELRGEADEVVGSDVAEAAMRELREINRGRRRIGRARI